MDFIEVFESVLPEALCRELIEVCERHPALGDGVTGSGLDPQKKRSKDLTLDAHKELRDYLVRVQTVTLECLATYCRRHPFALIGGVTPTLTDPRTLNPLMVDRAAFDGLSNAQLFSLIKAIFRSGVVNFQMYETGRGGYPHWHSEIYPRDPRCDTLHRVLFTIYYLNDVKRGGETEFYSQERRISPRRGTLVIAPAGFTHAHRGNVPISGNKYILSSWILFRRSEELFAERPA